jgi:putative pyrroloquinoline-quinone binding quinoprotein/putative pyrroloquinoline-quinone-binding quinoprotein
MTLTRLLVLLIVVAGPPSVVHAQNWPGFRGARSGVVADNPALPDHWTTTENVAWKVDIPGRGWSSPVVWGDHVFVVTAINVANPVETLRPVKEYIGGSLGGPMTGNDVNRDQSEHRWVVYDVNARTGAIRWERVLRTGAPAQPVHQKNSLASETPVTDGERVYVYLGYAGLYALDFDGKIVWSKPMDVLPVRQGWGSAGSPALHEGRLYIVNDNEAQSFLAAYDTKTGNELWRVARDERSNWSSPFIWQNALRTEIVTTGTKKVRSYDTNGRLLWELSGMTSLHAATPAAAGGFLYVSSGYPTDATRPVYAIRPGATGDISLKPDQRTNDYVVWSHPTLAGSYPSGLVAGDTYYMLLDRGIVTATDAQTGSEVYGRQRIATDGGTFSASPWTYNGKVFALNEDGTTYVIQAGREFKVVGKNPLDEFTLATPAIANGSLFIRTATKLYCIGSRPGAR